MSKAKKDIKLFNKWSYKDVKIKDWTLERYINLKPVIIPHSAGKHEHKRFWKTSKVSIVERFVNRLLAPGFIGSKIKGHKSSYSSGKKSKLLTSIKNAFTGHNTRGANAFESANDKKKRYAKVLNISPDAPLSEIKKAYRKQAKAYHPDTIASKGMSEDYVAYSNKKLSEINEAYDFFKDLQSA